MSDQSRAYATIGWTSVVHSAIYAINSLEQLAYIFVQLTERKRHFCARVFKVVICYVVYILFVMHVARE